ncbi:sodium/sugar symporter [Qipengyuania sp. DSG2-2]|uniref:sodium/sugar symporter n=1 Tax=Qipengyuania sp. DGS2-2 TaxID=3349631 RepID=UPI0036D2663B
MTLATIDLVIIAVYAFGLLGIALYVSREPAGHAKNTEDYFLAGRALPWWAIGASLIASNISAEQIIGQSGEGFAIGIAIAAYEWQAAIVLLIVAKYFLPIFLKRKIYTMPQFLEQRYGSGVKNLMSVFWVALYTAVNLTAVLWLGGLAIDTLTGWGVMTSMIALAGFAVLYSLYGGLKAVALTDIIQVVILIIGGFAITWFALDALPADGAIAGFGYLMQEMPGHFEMILDEGDNGYDKLPGIWTLLGGLWVLHFSYWGFNQYIIQRALGAENLGEAQKGLAFAAFLKLLVPFIVVIPGIAAVILAQQGMLNQSALNEASDRTYGELMGFAPAGLRGLVFAALIAAVVSSLASMMNSISTIFTMDLYRSWKPEQDERHYVLVGRITAFAAMAIALVLARPFLGGLESAFQTVQEYTGYIAPGVVIVFLLGFFDKKANTAGAFTALIGSVVLNIVVNAVFPELPFVVRIWIVFVVGLIAAIVVSRMTGAPDEERTVNLSDIGFGTTALFNGLAMLTVAILAGLYIVLW